MVKISHFSGKLNSRYKKSLYEYLGDTPVSFFAVVQCSEISIYTLSVVHAEFKLLYIVSMPTVLPSDNQLTGFQCRHAWRGPEHTRQEDLKFSGSQGPPRASGSMTVPSLQNTMTAKEKKGHGDKSLCS